MTKGADSYWVRVAGKLMLPLQAFMVLMVVIAWIAFKNYYGPLVKATSIAEVSNEISRALTSLLITF